MSPGREVALKGTHNNNKKMQSNDRKKMIQQGFDTVAEGYTYMDVGVTGNAGMYRKYGSRVTQDAVTESDWQ